MRFITFIICFVVTAGPSQGADDLQFLTQQLAILTNPELPAEVREVAEELLIESNDARMLRPLLHNLHALTHEWRKYTLVPLRNRLWDHFAQHAEPEEDRKRIYVELFDEWKTEYEFRMLIKCATDNHSHELEQKLWDIFADREQDAAIRTGSLNTLVAVAPRKYTRQIIEMAWEERGSEVATNVGGRLGGPRYRDSQINVLKLDWYERERNPETRSLMRIDQMVDRMDSYFGNITGLYEEVENRRERLDAIVRQRNSLHQEARATGDDTRLREFEAELAERQRQELETRIERIDAWIAANRERLEQEAVAFAHEQQRRRELQRSSEP